VARHLPPPVLVVGGIVLLGGVAMAVLTLLLTAVPVALVGVVAVLVVRRRLRRVAHVPATVAPGPSPQAAWRAARTRFAELRTEYAAYECDPMSVLRLPALADVGVPSTARFVDAFARAQALDTDAPPTPQHAADYVAAADAATRAWRAAHDAAERIRHSRLSPAERGSVERTIKLLTTARDSDSDAERLAAYSLARTELAKLEKAGVVHLPRASAAALDAAARGALPSG